MSEVIGNTGNIEMVGSELMSKLVGTNSFKTLVFYWGKKKQKRGRKEETEVETREEREKEERRHYKGQLSV
jgi:hypothetical protein